METTVTEIVSQQEEDAGVAAESSSMDAGNRDGVVYNYRGWKAMPYVVGNEMFEKLGTIGMLSNMLVYLTTVYHMENVNAATLVNIFYGTSNLATIFGAYVSDTHLGRYTIIAAATVASFTGMLILTLTAVLHVLHPSACNSSEGHQCEGPNTFQLIVLLVSFFFLVVGSGGIRPCNLAFGADQFDPHTDDGRHGIAKFINWYYFTYAIGMILSATVITYLQSNVSWALGFAVPTALVGLSCVVFLMGTRLYVCIRPEGSPFTGFIQVLIAAALKRHLHRARGTEIGLFNPPHQSNLVSKLSYTDQFVCLDKAAIQTAEDALCSDGRTPVNQWRLCTMQQVEEVKCLARIIPVWSSGIIFFIVLNQLGTYVVLQVAQTDRRISKSSSFQIPQGSFIIFQLLALMLWLPVYGRLVVPMLRRFTKHEDGMTLLHRIGVGVALSVVTMLVSAAVEYRRRRIGSSMSCFWLVPQQLLAGLSEALGAIGHVEFYYRQFPENMQRVVGALYCLGGALAGYASGLMVTVVHQATRGQDGRPDWLAQDLDKGRVDLFYLVTAVIAAVNLVYFVVCARWYKSKKSDDDNTTNVGAGDVTMTA